MFVFYGLIDKMYELLDCGNATNWNFKPEKKLTLVFVRVYIFIKSTILHYV